MGKIFEKKEDGKVVPAKSHLKVLAKQLAQLNKTAKPVNQH